MTICSSCSQDKPKIEFAAVQHKKKADKRKCKDCTCDSGENKKKLIQWLLQHKSKLRGIELIESEAGRVLQSTVRFSPAHEIMFIPLECILTDTQSRICYWNSAISKAGVLLLSDHTWLAVYLLEERSKQDQSSYWPYIQTLPKSYPKMPLFIKDVDVLLEGSMCVSMLTTRKESILKEYNTIKTAVPLFPFTLYDFQWARTVVITRVFNCKLNSSDNVGQQCLVPLADMMNHSLEPNVGWGYDCVQGGFVMTALKNIFRGTQLLDSYGVKCNSRFFVNYGFTLSNNQDNNQAAIFLPALQNPVLFKYTGPATSYDDGFCGYGYLLETKKEFKVTEEKCFRFQVSTISLCMSDTMKDLIIAMFSYARLAVLEEQDYGLLSENVTVNRMTPALSTIPYLHIRNEINAIEFIARNCLLRLSDFSTTLTEDRQRLLECRPYTTNYDILSVLTSEKEVLHYYLDLSEQVKTDGTIFKLKNQARFKPYYKLFLQHKRTAYH